MVQCSDTEMFSVVIQSVWNDDVNNINYHRRFSVPAQVNFRDGTACCTCPWTLCACSRVHWLVHVAELSTVSCCSGGRFSWGSRMKRLDYTWSAHPLIMTSLSPLCFPLAGAALMDISEVHKRVHLELDENVSAKFCPLFLRFFHSAVAPAHLYEKPCMQICCFECGTVKPFLKTSTSHVLKKKKRCLSSSSPSKVKEQEVGQRKERNRFRLLSHLLLHYLPGK